MKHKELSARYLLLTFSLFLIAFGVSLITKSALGAAPISALAYVLSLFTPLSMGFYMLVVNALLIIGQMILLGGKGIREFKKELILQIPISIAFSVFVDMSLWMQSSIVPNNYVVSLFVLFLGAFVLALGIAIEVIANVAMNSGEYIVQIATRKFKKDFGTLKIINDVTLVSFAIIAALVLSGGTLQGVREGTVIVALVTGFIVRSISPYLGWLKRAVNSLHEENVAVVEDEYFTSNPIITIAREYGCGGHEVGEMLSKRLGIPLYDKEMIEMAAKEMGVTEENIQNSEQHVSNLFLFNMVQDFEAPIEKSLSYSDTLFVEQCRIIKRIAMQGPCIIIGRLADYVLKEDDNVVSVFLHAAKDAKIERIMKRENISYNEAQEKILKVNSARARHYWHYTDSHWEDASHYSLTLDTSIWGIDKSAQIIDDLYRQKC